MKRSHSAFSVRHKSLAGAVLAAALLAGNAAAAPLGHEGYAVLFSGGFDSDNNHDRYYTQTQRMWDIVVTDLNFDVSNVFVLFADGTDPAVDRSSGVNSNWDMVVNAGGNILAATHDNLQSTLATLANQMDHNDTFYFWSFDHGSNPGPDTTDNDVELVAWDSPWIRDDELASWVAPFSVKAEIYAFAQCFAYGMVDDLSVLAEDSNRFAAWAALGCESSFDSGWADAWADGFDAGLWSTWQLGEYAKVHDPFGPSGLGIEHPGYAGRNFWGLPVSEPMSLALLMSGLAGMALLRRPRA